MQRFIEAFSKFAARDWRRPHWRVFYYHAVLESQRQRFTEHLDWLSEHFQWCSVSGGVTALAGRRIDRPLASLTFDDADQTVFDVAMPLLGKRGIQACIYTVPTYVDRGVSYRDPVPRPVMNWHQLKHWLDQGHEVGSHTFTHCNSPQCARERLEQEAKWSCEAIQENLGIEVSHFAYPWGQHNGWTEQVLRHTGCFTSLATTLRGAMETGQNAFRLRRDRMDLSKTPDQIATLMRLADRFYELRRLKILDPRRYLRRRKGETWEALASRRIATAECLHVPAAASSSELRQVAIKEESGLKS